MSIPDKTYRVFNIYPVSPYPVTISKFSWYGMKSKQ